jgi:glycosyltransferase involved in cell wall biosynthesis
MKILFNCTTNVVGGGVKNSAIFIKYAIEDFRFEWGFAISSQVKEILDRWGIDTSNMELFIKSPAKNYSQRKRLLEYSNNNNFNIVFTMAGPAYVKFDIKHVMGMSNPYITHTDYAGLSVGKSLLQTLKSFALLTYQGWFARKADYWIFQTNESRNGFCKRLFVSKDKTKVITNSIGQEFLEQTMNSEFNVIDKSKKIKFFCPAAAYKHKALHLIPALAKEMKGMCNFEFEFILTIDPNSEYWRDIKSMVLLLEIENTIRTIGAFNYADSASLYQSSDLIFVPSLLETFSASYLEAFAVKKPLIVADKGFAKDVCKEAAVYINPFDAYESAKQIVELVNSSTVQEKLVKNGSNVIKLYGDQKSRFDEIVSYLQSVANA